MDDVFCIIEEHMDLEFVARARSIYEEEKEEMLGEISYLKDEIDDLEEEITDYKEDINYDDL